MARLLINSLINNELSTESNYCFCYQKCAIKIFHFLFDNSTPSSLFTAVVIKTAFSRNI